MNASIPLAETNGYLISSPVQRERVYSFFDDLYKKHYGVDGIKVRQIVELDDLEVLSEARIRLYGQRKKYYETLFGEACGLDLIDRYSYIFAIYLNGQIVGTQRITPFPHESARYIPDQALKVFAGRGYPDRYVEFSRLIIDKNAPVKDLVTALSSMAGTLVALNTGYRNYITYVKPRLHGRFSQFSFDHEYLPFQIPERGEHVYALFKGNLLSAVIDFFNLGCRPEHLTDMDTLISLIKKSKMEVLV